MGRKGSTEPRIFTPPLRELTPETSLGYEVVEFAENILGIELRPWQKWLFIHALELDMRTVPGNPEFDADTPENRYFDLRFRRVVVLVARQNGKTVCMSVLGLWRLFLDGASEVLSSAQNLRVAEKDLANTFKMAKRSPELAQYLPYRVERGQWVPYMRTANGSNQIELAHIPDDLEDVLDISGAMPVWYVVATNGGGRSFSADLALMDELREHKNEDVWDAVAPTTAERPRNQIWAFSNAGDARSVVLRRLRTVAYRAWQSGDTDDERLGLFEWSADPECTIFDPDGWVAANPSLGHGARTEEDMLALAKEAVDPDNEKSDENGFRTEYLCQWVESLEPGKIDPELWSTLADPDSTPADDATIHVGVDVASEGTHAHIVIAAERADGRWHLEVVASRAGYGWVPAWLEARRGTWFSGTVGMQVKGSPSNALAPLLRQAGFDVAEWQATEMTSSVLGFFTAIQDRDVRWLGRDPAAPTTPTVLEAAAVGVKDRKSGDTFIWDREKSTGDAAPFVAANIAWWMGHREEQTAVSAYSGDDWGDDFDDDLDDDLDEDGNTDGDVGLTFV